MLLAQEARYRKRARAECRQLAWQAESLAGNDAAAPTEGKRDGRERMAWMGDRE